MIVKNVTAQEKRLHGLVNKLIALLDMEDAVKTNFCGFFTELNQIRIDKDGSVSIRFVFGGTTSMNLEDILDLASSEEADDVDQVRRDLEEIRNRPAPTGCCEAPSEQ